MTVQVQKMRKKKIISQNSLLFSKYDQYLTLDIVLNSKCIVIINIL